MNISVPGFLASGISAGLKSTRASDFGLIVSENPASAAALFTSNKIKAAPVIDAQERLQKSGHMVRAVLVNSGNANACTGSVGIEHVRTLCSELAGRLEVPDNQVLMSSTGIIGVPLPLGLLTGNLPRLTGALSADGINDFAHAIMTTDTFPKVVVRVAPLAGKEVRLCGIAKGAGMIMPRMATLLCFVLTDCAIAPDYLQSLFCEAVNASLNAITIDGDTSTNDTALMLANGLAGNTLLRSDSPESGVFRESLCSLLNELARLILKDAEGATKLVTIRVVNAATAAEAKDIAYQVANSPLVKTSFFGEDLNWGRIMAAIGRTDYDIEADCIDIFFNSTLVVQKSSATGQRQRAEDIVKDDEFTVTIDLHHGSAAAEVRTTDLTIDYIKINSAYPT